MGSFLSDGFLSILNDFFNGTLSINQRDAIDWLMGR